MVNVKESCSGQSSTDARPTVVEDVPVTEEEVKAMFARMTGTPLERPSQVLVVEKKARELAKEEYNRQTREGQHVDTPTTIRRGFAKVLHALGLL